MIATLKSLRHRKSLRHSQKRRATQHQAFQQTRKSPLYSCSRFGGTAEAVPYQNEWLGKGLEMGHNQGGTEKRRLI